MSDNRQEAYQQLDSRLADMRRYLELASEGVDVYDEEIYGHTDDELSPVDEWGLEWAKATTNHRDETVTYEHVLSTGGPHEEFDVTFDPTKGTVERVVFVSLPWFGREEIAVNDQAAVDFYEQFYGELVQAEHDEARRS